MSIGLFVTNTQVKRTLQVQNYRHFCSNMQFKCAKLFEFQDNLDRF